ncbi:uncharacterized protein LOC115720986 [Cannabis sativa]|uniref:uncharacterized protein LOC115720986 n=1 Tax=Cannabis sativa TaxID=3483 RepID=UPI0029CA52FD|nr:uncharacterized protein LOC115720986 [Cannabis sativa]
MNKDDIPWILGIQTMRDCGEDELIWNPTIDGEYTVASGYRMKQSEKEGAETSNKSITKGWWTAVWHSNLTPKIKNFIWRVCHNWVPSKTELAKRGIKLDRTCTGCWNQIETISHAIWQCPRLKYVWKETGLWHLFPKSLGLMSDLMEFLMFMKNKCSNQDFERFLGMSWMVWSQRNNRIFQNKNPPLKSWTPWALDFVNHALTKATDIKDKKRDKSVIRWKAPPKGSFLINCDAALSPDQMGSGIVAVIRDFKGNLVAAEVKYHNGYVSVLMAKCMALRLGLYLSHKMNTNPFYLTSDNLTAINHLLSRKASRTDWGLQLKDILCSHLLDDCIEIRYVSRDSNRVAHSLARWAFKLKSNSFWSEVLPSCAAAILDAEKSGLV